MNSPVRIAVLAITLVASACTVENSGSISVKAICAIPEDECVFDSAECDMQYFGDVALDLSLQEQLYLFIQVNNQMEIGGGLTPGGTNVNDAYAQEFEVDYAVEFGPAGLVVPSTSGGISSTWIPAESSAVVEVNAITEQVASALWVSGVVNALGEYVDLIANVRLKGRLDDQSTNWKTGPHRIPIRVCYGCLPPPACAPDETLEVVCGLVGQTPRSLSCESSSE